MWTSFCQNAGRAFLICMSVAASSAIHPLLLDNLISLIILGLSLTFGLKMGLKKDSENSDEKNEPETEKSPTFATYKSKTEVYKNAAVVTDSKIASDIGKGILLHHGGNAVDATVAALLATGVVHCHSAGLGGGSVYVIYDKKHGWHTVNGRSNAPMAATEDMFMGEENRQKSLLGGMASGIPSEVKGLYEVHKKFGKVPWKDIVRPTIRLCEDGVPLLKPVFIALGRLQSREDKMEFKEYFDHNHNILPVGTKVKLPRLAKTLHTISEDPLSFYNGSLAKDVIADVNEKGGIMDLADLQNFSLKWSAPTKLSLPDGFDVFSISSPCSGPVVSYILNILSGYKFNPNSIATTEASVLTYHRVIEAMKFAYSKRTLLGDDAFINKKADVEEMLSLECGEKTRAKITDNITHEIDYYTPSFSFTNDHGTTHISVIDSQGNAVSVSSTINTYFGCRVKGKRTGIIFNSVMDDFSTPNKRNYFGLPPSPANFIRPGKRPLSSMSPIIVWDRTSKKIKLVTGAAGGTKVATATAQNIIDVLWFKMPLPASVDRPRLHHQLAPNVIQVEKDYPKAIRNGLKGKDHEMGPMQGMSTIQAALVLENGIVATSDYRKDGQPSGF